MLLRAAHIGHQTRTVVGRGWAVRVELEAEERRVVTLRGGPEPTPKTEVGAMLGELTRLFTEPTVPDEITTQAGALLYRHFC